MTPLRGMKAKGRRGFPAPFGVSLWHAFFGAFWLPALQWCFFSVQK
jgi:hypothetical protein